MMKRALSLLLCLIMVLGLAVPSVQAAESSSGNIMDGVYIDGDSGANIVIDGNTVTSSGENTKLPNPSELVTNPTTSSAPVVEYVCKCADLATAVEHVGICNVKAPYMQLCEMTAQELFALWGSYTLLEQDFIMGYLYNNFPLKHVELQKLLSAPTGSASETYTDGTTVSVQGIPQDGSLTVGEAADEIKDIVDAYVAENEEASTPLFGYDVSVQDGQGADWQPETSVKMELELPGQKLHKNTKVYVVHVDDEGNATTIEATVTEDGKIAFETPGFSAFYGFTVDFDYEGVQFSIPGGTSIKLSELFENLKMPLNAEDVVDVYYTDYTQITVEQLEGDWLLTSLKAFDTEEKMTLTMSDGTVYNIKVTDISGERADCYFSKREEYDHVSEEIDMSTNTGDHGNGMMTVVLKNATSTYNSNPHYQPSSAAGVPDNLLYYFYAQPLVFDGRDKNGAFEVIIEKGLNNTDTFYLETWQWYITGGAIVNVYFDGFDSNDEIIFQQYYYASDSAGTYNPVPMFTIDDGSLYFNVTDSSLLPSGRGFRATTTAPSVVFDHERNGTTHSDATVFIDQGRPEATGYENFVANRVTFRDSKWRAIYCKADGVDTLRLDNCTFTNSMGTASDAGGVIYLEGYTNGATTPQINVDGVAQAHINHFILNNCTFNKNTLNDDVITPLYGGAIFCAANLDDTQFINCTFNDFEAQQFGGAVAFGFEDDLDFGMGALTISGCTFNNCKALGNEGGAVSIRVQFGKGITFSASTSKNCTFTNCTSKGQGGSIFIGLNKKDATRLKVGNVLVNGCTFSNSTSSSMGGSIAMDCDEIGDVTISNSTFTKSSGTYGGTISVASSKTGDPITVGDVTIQNCQFTNSHASNVGGAVCLIDGTYNSISFLKTNFDDCVSPRYGGGICMREHSDDLPFVVNKNISVIGCNFTNCHAGYLTWDSFTDGTHRKVIKWDHDDNPLTPEIEQLNGVGGGGGISIGGTIKGRVVISGEEAAKVGEEPTYSLFQNCTSWNNAAAIFFTNDTIIVGTDAAYPNEPAVKLQYLNIDKCFARDAGFAIYVGQDVIPSFHMLNCTVQNCGFFDLTDPDFPRGNVFPENGGTLPNQWRVTPTIYDPDGFDADGKPKYKKNEADTTAAATIYQAKWETYTYADLCRSTDTGGTFRTIGNTFCIAEITDCQFLNNKSYSGGAGVYWNSLQIYEYKTGHASELQQYNGKLPALTLTRTLFDGNYAHSNGGGIYCEATITINSCEFKNNVAGSYGGAIAQQVYNNDGRDLSEGESNQIILGTATSEVEGQVNNPTSFHHNRATYGGAISITVAKTDSVDPGKLVHYPMLFTLGGSHVYQNVATANGGGIYYATYTYANDDEQAEVDYFQKQININNGLIWGNVAGASATQIEGSYTPKVGDQLVIAAVDSNVAMGTTQNGNDREQATVTKYSPTNMVSFDATTQIITLKAGSTSGTYKLLAGSNYLGSADGTTENASQLANVAQNHAKNDWTIQIDPNGNATIKVFANSNSDTLRHTLRYNAGANPKLFNVYTTNNVSSHKDIAIYRVTAESAGIGVAELVTDVNTLRVNDRIIIKAKDYNIAMASTFVTTYRNISTVEDRARNNITYGADAQVITLVSGTEAGTFGLKVEDGKYLRTVSTSENNILHAENVLDKNSSWSISISAATGVARVTSKETTTQRNTIFYNNNNGQGGWFNNYQYQQAETTNIKFISIYRVNSKDDSYRTATLVTNDASLREGDRIIIVAMNYDIAMGAERSDTTRKAVSVAKLDSMTFGLDTEVVTLVPGDSENTVAMQTRDGKYLMVANNKVGTTDVIDNTSSWTLSVSGGELTAKASNGYYLRYNTTTKRFSGYGNPSSGNDIMLYKLGIETGGGNGGGIYMDSNQYDTSKGGYSQVSISGGSIYGNIAYVGNGGGVYLTGENALCTITGTDTMVGVGTVGVDENGNPVVGNKATSLSTGGNSYIGGNGGGIAIFGGARIEMTGGSVSNNQATVAGGGIAVHGSSMSFSDGSVKNNKALFGGGISVLNAGDVSNVVDVSDGKNKDNPDIDWGMEFTNGTVSGNIASTVGGGICLSQASTMKLNGGTVKENYVATATTTGDKTTYSYAEGQNGGGIAICQGSKMNIYSGSVASNYAYDGGGIIIQGGSKLQMLPTQGTTIGGSVSSNIATPNDNNINDSIHVGRGGGILLGDPSDAGINNTLFMDQGAVEMNTAEYGGGIYIAQGNTVKLKGGKVSANSGTYLGGGVYAYGATLTVNGGEICENSGNNSGGGIYARTGSDNAGSIVTITEGKIHDNQAPVGWGVGIYIWGKNTETIISGGEIYKNISNDLTGCGGGINAEYNSKVTVTGGKIYENKVPAYGGGIHSYNNATVIVKGGLIENNTADIGGGGIALRENSTATITTSDDGKDVGKINGNTSAKGGGVYVIGGAEVSVIKGYITNNVAKGKPVQSANVTTAHLKEKELVGVGGGVYVADGKSDTDQSVFKLTSSPVAIYGNTADFAADDVFANANHTKLTVPTVDYMDLADFDMGPEGWVEDYVEGDTSYSSGLNTIPAGTTILRYRNATPNEQRYMLISSNSVTSKVNAANTYVCMTLGIPHAYKDNVVVDFAQTVNIDVWSNDLFLYRDATNNEFGITGKETHQGSYVLKEIPTTGIKENNGIYYSKITENKGPAGTYDRKELQDDFAKLTNNGDGTMTYQPTAMYTNGEDVFCYAVAHGGFWYYGIVTVIPATTIYYEDNISSIKYHTNGDAKFETLAEWETAGEELTNLLQGTNLDADKIYGYDSSYAGITTAYYSGGAAHKVQVNGDHAILDNNNDKVCDSCNGFLSHDCVDSNLVDGYCDKCFNKLGRHYSVARATFTFTGTGFDLISLCNSQTTSVMVNVYAGDGSDLVFEDNPSTPEYDVTLPLATYYVDTWYKTNDTLYQVPVIKADMTKVQQSEWDPTIPQYDKDGKLIGHGDYQFWYRDYGYGTYTVEIFVSTSWFNPSATDFYLDAIRIYNPTGAHCRSVVKADGKPIDGTEKVLRYDMYGIPVKDANGNSIYAKRYIQATDKDGNLIYDDYGMPIYRTWTDENGQTVYEFEYITEYVMKPVGSSAAKDAYLADGEGWPVYQELRDLFLTQNEYERLRNMTDEEAAKLPELDGILFIDGNDRPTIAEYMNLGPNNEVYLAPNQAISFTLMADNYSEFVEAVHIGMRSASGTASVKIEANGIASISKELSSTDLYYDLSSMIGHVVRITNTSGTGNAVVSISNLKVTHSDDPNAGSAEIPAVYRMFKMNRTYADIALGILTPEELVESPVVTPKHPALSFNGMVCYNVFFSAENLGNLTADDLGLAVFSTEDTEGTIETAREVIYGATEIDGLYMTATGGVHAKYLGDKQYFRAFARKSDGTYVYSRMVSYSALDYAKNALAKSSDVKLKQLVVAMLNYGAEAQKFFGYKTDDLMNASLTADDQALLAGYDATSLNAVGKVDASKVGVFTSNRGFTTRKPAISFKGAFEINYFFTPANAVDGDMKLYFWNEDTYNSVTELTAENADKVEVMTLENGTYAASSDEIAAKYLDKTVYVAAVYESDGVTYCSGVLPYSIAAYCQDSPAGVQELATAAAIYGCTAKEYFGV